MQKNKKQKTKNKKQKTNFLNTNGEEAKGKPSDDPSTRKIQEGGSCLPHMYNHSLLVKHDTWAISKRVYLAFVLGSF